jgi:hypothetical protein
MSTPLLLHWLHLDHSPLTTHLALAISFLLTLPIFFSVRFATRLCALSSVFLGLTMGMGHQHIYNHLDIWFYSAVLLTLSKSPLTSRFDLPQSILLCQFQCVLTIAISGVHKVLSLVENKAELQLSEILQYTVLSSSIAKNSYSPVTVLVLDNPLLSLWGWIAAVTLQIGTLILFIVMKRKTISGLLLIGFHLSTLPLMRVNFGAPVLAYVALFFFGDYVLERSDSYFYFCLKELRFKFSWHSN